MEQKGKRIGLFFGSFNPVHTGHMIIANYMVTKAGLDEVWMVVSPHNPLKEKKSLANDHDRLHLVNLAIGDNPKIKASNIEFSLPRPSYTIDTLVYLGEKHPQHRFVLLMGGDNLVNIDKWKNHEKLLSGYEIFVYQRPRYEAPLYTALPSIQFMDAPLLDISATYIRESIKNGYSVEYLVPDRVYQYLLNSGMYR
ncbi:MAG: nicotinate-nucleotide adenylyltransferase [Saprospiraceae bacterium]|nr:nicotinate-nucleotide adenylyltransferase [Saprospiraceae bacterium]